VEPVTTRHFVEQIWDQSILPTLDDYIRIPSKSPAFDREWQSHGHMERALSLLTDWCGAQAIPELELSVERLPGRTPLIYLDLPGEGDDCVLLYGHYDKQPEFTGWREGLGPWTPVRDGDRLYGRGGADDGYSTFAAVTALRALEEQRVRHARCIVLIEGCEESGSYDLPLYLDALGARLGTPSLVVCLDSGCGNYDQLWGTTSLRGIVAGNLYVEMLREGVHSGAASGVVASSFRVLRMLLSRIEDERTGAIRPEDFQVQIPPERLVEAEQLAAIIGDKLPHLFPLLPGVRPVSDDPTELILNRTWRPALSVTGAEGLPPLESAGNVLRPLTAVKLSLRIPPTCDAVRATARLKEILEADPPYGAHVRFEPEHESPGWNAPASQPWLRASIDRASRAFFGREAAYTGEGGSIPFMAMLGERFPQAQFVVTGVLGPHSNAHGPNEFLHIPTGRRVTQVIAQVLADHAARLG
jgi:acetylornithine deacetylase/succinyl-diaminopimelate desuccinylase-like protein